MHVCIRVCSTLIVRRVRIARPLGMCTRMRSYRPVQDPFHDRFRDPFTRPGALFVVARALEETRAVERLLLPALGKPRGHRSALLRLCLPVGLFSAFLNNTPIVAMLLPICEGWAARCNLSIKVLPYLLWPQLLWLHVHGYPLDQGGTLLLRWLQLNGYANSGAAHAAVIRIDARRYVHAHRHIDQPRAQRAGTLT